MTQQRWFYAHEGQQLGPFPLEQLQHFIATQQVLPTSLVWTEGMPQWLPAGDVPVLFPNHSMVPSAGAPVVPYQNGVDIGSVQYAGFWVRFGAYFLDGLVLLLPSVILAVLIPIFGNLVLVWLYYAVMESSQTQGTLGKMAFRLKVTDLQGARLGFGQATGRYFGKYISSLILCIGFMMAGWTEKKQALHDMMAGTLVVRQ